MSYKKLDIRKIENGTKPEDESVMLFANEDVQLSEYALLDKTFGKSATVSNLHRHLINLPSFVLKKGEFVSIYTGSGKTQAYSGKFDDGTPWRLTYLFWGIKECIWNDHSKEQATLIHFTVVDGKNVQ
jgi:hypothetical protein